MLIVHLCFCYIYVFDGSWVYFRCFFKQRGWNDFRKSRESATFVFKTTGLKFWVFKRKWLASFRNFRTSNSSQNTWFVRSSSSPEENNEKVPNSRSSSQKIQTTKYIGTYCPHIIQLSTILPIYLLYILLLTSFVCWSVYFLLW